MSQFRSRGKGKNRKVYPINASSGKRRKSMTVASNIDRENYMRDIDRMYLNGTLSKEAYERARTNAEEKGKSAHGYAISLKDANGTRRFQKTGMSAGTPDHPNLGVIKAFETKAEAEAYINRMTLMTQKAYEPKIVDLKQGALSPKDQELRDSQLAMYNREPRYTNGVLYEWDYKTKGYKKATTGKNEDSGLSR